MSKIIKWKYNNKFNVWYGTVKGDNEPLISIQGSYCVTDLRHCREMATERPRHYSVMGLTVDEAKQLAEDVVTGNNFDKHEQNRLELESKSRKTATLIDKAEKLLQSLENDTPLNEVTHEKQQQIELWWDNLNNSQQDWLENKFFKDDEHGINTLDKIVFCYNSLNREELLILSTLKEN